MTATHTSGNPDVLCRLDRRQSDRWPIEGHATAFCVAGYEFGRMHDLRLLDDGHNGLGAISEDPIDPGTVVTLGFARPGMIARRGVITRCLPCGEGYRVGIRYEQRMAA